MKEEINKIETLFHDASLNDIEKVIAETTNCNLYRENLSLLAKFTVDEIDASGLAISQIEDLIKHQPKKIIEFGQSYLKKFNPKTLSTGIAISYSIFIIYLEDKSEKELLEYLQRRRIPSPKNILEKLLAVKKEMNF